MIKKIDLLRNAMTAGDWKKALSIAAKFPRLGEQRDPILRGHGAITNPRFYTQIGKNPDKLIEDGIQALKERYSA